MMALYAHQQVMFWQDGHLVVEVLEDNGNVLLNEEILSKL